MYTGLSITFTCGKTTYPYFKLLADTQRFDYTPAFSVPLHENSITRSVFDSALISLLSTFILLCSFIFTHRFLPSFSFFPTLTTFMLLLFSSLLQSIPEHFIHHFLTTDLSLSELNVPPRSSLPMSALLRSLASSLAQPISIRSRSNTGSNPLEDSFYLLHSVTKSIHVLSFPSFDLIG